LEGFANVARRTGKPGQRKTGLLVLQLAVVLPTITTIGVLLVRDTSVLNPELALWTLTVAVVEVLPVPVWRGLQVSVGFPLLMAVAFLYPPAAAGLAAFLGPSDPRELRGQVGVLRAAFNRCQVALSVMVASALFQSLADIEAPAVAQLSAALVAAIADYLLSTGLVAAAVCLDTGMPLGRVVREMKIGRPSEFLVSYLGLAFFGLFLAHIYKGSDFWVLPVAIIPLLLARQMFFRSKALEEAHKVLQDREHVLRALSNRMAEERQDERQQIAAFLHDDLAQLLFRLSIQVDVARRHLDAGKLDDTERVLSEIKETKNRTSDRIRALIRDLHRSPLGRAGLAEALRSFIAEAGRDGDVQFHVEFEDVDLPAPIALLMYHIAREGVMNALKHADASHMWLAVRQAGDEVELVLRDDGAGFDSEAPEPEGHYGLTMMRERATVGGGTFTISSAPGAGATITVRFPTSWLQPEGPAATDVHEQRTPPRDGASRGASSSTSEPVHA
jgi:signal transduction histidine kinase